MDRELFVADRDARWVELDSITRRGRAIRRHPDAIKRLAELYRSTAADLAIARRRFPGDPLCIALERRVVTARQQLANLDRSRPRVVHFLTTGYWRRIRERPRLLLVAFLFLMVPFVLSAVWATREPVKARGLVPGGAESVTSRDRADFGLSADEKAAVSSQIFTNNIRVTFIAFGLGVIGGVGALVFLGYQGVVLGATFGLAIHVGNGEPLFEFVFPHGILELSCIIVAGAAGMRLGWALVAPGYQTRASAFRAEAIGAIEMIIGTAVVLTGCGIVEGSLSTSGIGLVPAIAVGVVLGGGFWSLVFLRGRPDRAPVDPEAPVVVARPRLTTASAASL